MRELKTGFNTDKFTSSWIFPAERFYRPNKCYYRLKSQLNQFRKTKTQKFLASKPAKGFLVETTGDDGVGVIDID